MATPTNIADVLSDLTTATQSAITALPDPTTLLPPDNGISLLDIKNDLFLSYLQALALRNLNVVRAVKDGKSLAETKKLNSEITRKLVEQRVYIERGVWPLESKIKYQIDRVVKAADDDERAGKLKADAKKVKELAKMNGRDESEEEDSDDEDESDSEAEEDEVAATMHRPDPSRFAQSNVDAERERQVDEGGEGVYRPPRISATSMPTTETKERKERRPGRSATLDEYVSTELSQAPLAVPSIGSTITSGGRKTKDAKQLAREQERQNYEETHLVRLPPESRKERSKNQRRDRGGGFGGEEWRELGDSVDRIGDLTRRKGKDNALDRSRKRRAVEDSPRDDGIGAAFDARKKRMMKK
ncbi:hypothetical protein BDY17DRAFT_243003, partial [Neohortaea acidophila]